MSAHTNQALDNLFEGNTRFVASKPIASNSPAHRATLVNGQAPIAAILCCADSRVAPEIVFDQQLANLFVCRIAGNVVTDEIIDSLQYAVGPLGCSLIVVMGHTGCGAVGLAVDSHPTEGVFSLVDIPNDSEDAVAFNAEQGIYKLISGSIVIEKLVKSNEIAIVAGVYDMESGKFDAVAQTQLQ